MNGSKSHTEVTSSVLPASVPSVEDAQEKGFKEQLMDRASQYPLAIVAVQPGLARIVLVGRDP